MGGIVGKSSSQKTVEYLNATPFFLAFDEEELVQCSKYFNIKNVKQNQVIDDHAFIVVVDGLLSISTLVPVVEGVDKKKKKKSSMNNNSHVVERLCVKKKGDFFSKASNEAMTSAKGNKIVRSFDFTTIKALQDSKLLILNKKKLKEFVQKHSEQARLLLQVLSVDFNKLLEPVPFLSGLPMAKLTMLAEMFSFESFKDGDIVVREGEPSGKFYVVLSGEFRVLASTDKKETRRRIVDSEGEKEPIVLPQRSERLLRKVSNSGTETDGENNDKTEALSEVNIIELAVIGSGSYFGEMSLICNMPRSATVVAKGKCLLASLDATQFHQFERVEQSVRTAISLHARERMVHRLYAFQIPFFAGIPMEKLIHLAQACDIIQPKEGETVIMEGTNSNYFYIVVHGVLNVSKVSQKNTILAELTDGAYFGEISLVTNTPHHATIVAATDSVLLTISMNGFKKFFQDSPELLVEFEMRVLGKKSIKLKHVLHHGLGLELFKKHLEAEFSQESINFWKDVQRYKGLMEKGDSEKGFALAEEIVNTYIKEDAQSQVNVSHFQRDETLKVYNSGKENIDVSLFDQAEVEIFKMMERDNFSRFKKSPLFEELVSAVVIYTNSDLDIDKEEKRRRSLLLTMQSEFDNGSTIVRSASTVIKETDDEMKQISKVKKSYSVSSMDDLKQQEGKEESKEESKEKEEK